MNDVPPWRYRWRKGRDGAWNREDWFPPLENARYRPGIAASERLLFEHACRMMIRQKRTLLAGGFDHTPALDRRDLRARSGLGPLTFTYALMNLNQAGWVTDRGQTIEVDVAQLKRFVEAKKKARRGGGGPNRGLCDT